jgi:hypothetical protein
MVYVSDAVMPGLQVVHFITWEDCSGWQAEKPRRQLGEFHVPKDIHHSTYNTPSVLHSWKGCVNLKYHHTNAQPADTHIV